MTDSKKTEDNKAKTFYAKTSIGHNMKTGQPEFQKGDKIMATHTQLAKWIKWGMVSEEKPKEEDPNENKRPRQLPVFPIKKDISSAKRPKDDEDDAKTREEAEGLLSVEQAEKQEKGNPIDAIKNANRMTKEERAEAKDPEIEIDRAQDHEDEGEEEEKPVEGDVAGSEDDTGVKKSKATDDSANARNVDPEPHGENNVKVKPKKVKSSDDKN